MLIDRFRRITTVVVTMRSGMVEIRQDIWALSRQVITQRYQGGAMVQRWSEGRSCPLAKIGYSRDGKHGMTVNTIVSGATQR